MADNDNPTETVVTENVTFEDWLASQPEEVKTRFEEGTQGLKTALSSERESAKSLSKQLKELQGKVEKGSELERQVNALQEKLNESERHSAFIDGAAAAGCSNVKAAYKLAKNDPDLWKRDGSPDWAAIKETAPEFFGKKNPDGNAGNGTKTQPDAGKGNAMDNLFRKRAGVIR